MPRTGRSRNTRRVTPTDTGESSNQSPLTLEFSSLTVTALRTRLREKNLPTNGKKAALIERLTQQPPQHLIQQSPSNNATTVHADSTPHKTNSEDINTSGDAQHAAAINSTTIPANLLAQLATYLQRTPESHQVRATPAAGQASDQPSKASELQYCIKQELPAADIPPPPQLSSQHIINPPVTVQGTNFTVSWKRYAKVSILILAHSPLWPCLVHQSLHHKPHSPLNSPLQVIHLRFNQPVAISESHPFLHG